MHEMALMRNVVDLVVEQAQEAGCNEVAAVYMIVGMGRDFVEEYVDSLFAFLARGTVAEHAELVVYRPPVTARCKTCGESFCVDLRTLAGYTCPGCGASKNYEFTGGFEFAVNRIEVRGRGETAA